MSRKKLDLQVDILDIHKGQKGLWVNLPGLRSRLLLLGYISTPITRNILEKGVQGSSEETLSCKGLEKQRFFCTPASQSNIAT